MCVQAIDMSALCVHPACFVALTLTSLRIEPSRPYHSQRNNFVINVSGRLLMVNQQDDYNVSYLPGSYCCILTNNCPFNCMHMDNYFLRHKTTRKHSIVFILVIYY